MCEAFSTYEQLCKKFEVPACAEVVKDTNALLKDGRVTIVETVFFLSCKNYSVEKCAQQSKDDINAQIRGFGRAKIFPVKDLHGCLWKSAQAVVTGKKPV